MNEALVAGRYTKALFELSVEKNCLDVVKSDLEYIYSIFIQLKEFKILLFNPTLKPSVKTKIFHQIFNFLHPITVSFIDLIFNNRRENILPFVSLNFIKLYNESKGIENVILRVAIAIPEDLQKSIQNILQKELNHDIVLSLEEDKSLIGGFILRIGDKQIDASIKKKLKIYKNQLNQTQIKI